jgi:hypothetical protein
MMLMMDQPQQKTGGNVLGIPMNDGEYNDIEAAQ